jgi:serine O-acetyltransferase
VDVFRADMAAHFPPLSHWRFRDSLRYPVMAWQRRLRVIEAYEQTGSRAPWTVLWVALLRWRHRKDSERLGFTIPRHAFGPGLSIAHWGTITVEGRVKVGRNCRIHQGVTIGSSKGKVPTIGDDCFIGANACILGGIVLGNNIKVGAGAVVIHSFGDNAVLVGSPAVNKAN